MRNILRWSRVLVAFVITVIAVLAGVFWFDIPVYNFLRGFNVSILEYVDVIFSAQSWLILSFVVVVAFMIRKMVQAHKIFRLNEVWSRVRASYAFWVFCSVFCASAIGGVLKFVIGRARPIFYEALGMTGFFPFARDWAFHSMPSGHALASFAGLVMIGLIAPRARWFSWMLAGVIGVSRICVGAHWPSDVILGAFIGIFVAFLVRNVLARRSK